MYNPLLYVFIISQINFQLKKRNRKVQTNNDIRINVCRIAFYLSRNSLILTMESLKVRHVTSILFPRISSRSIAAHIYLVNISIIQTRRELVGRLVRYPTILHRETDGLSSRRGLILRASSHVPGSTRIRS